MSSPHEPIPPHDVFLNVRKAYRLLHDYQLMVRDGVGYVLAQLDLDPGAGGGRAKFAGDARAGYRYLSDSSWTWLPMMGWEFFSLKTLGPDELLSLSFFIIS